MNRNKGFDIPIYWSLTIIIGLLLLFPGLFMDGMFMDGTQYACVAKNLAHGLGSFWHPFLSETWWRTSSNEFLEHPPLAYYLQSQFFKIFGDSFLSERLYLLSIFITTLFIINRIWMELFQSIHIRRYSWLPLFLFLIIPLISWSFKNNVLEVSMSMFSLTAVFFLIKTINTNKYSYICLISAGIFIFLSSLVKGIPGLFPITFFIIYGILNKSFGLKKIISYSLLLVITITGLYILILFNDDAYDSLKFYFLNRLLYRIVNDPIVSNRFWILQRLILELTPILVLSISGYFYQKKQKLRHKNTHLSTSLLFFLIGLSASFPLMLTPVQRGFYLVPSFPYFAISFAIYLYAILDDIGKKIPARIQNKLKIFNKLFLIIGLILIFYTFKNYGLPSRDKEKLSDAHKISLIVEPFTTIEVTNEVYNDWSFQFYLLRYNDCYLKPSILFSSDYIILDKKNPVEGYKVTDQNFGQYFLFRKITQ